MRFRFISSTYQAYNPPLHPYHWTLTYCGSSPDTGPGKHGLTSVLDFGVPEVLFMREHVGEGIESFSLAKFHESLSTIIQEEGRHTMSTIISHWKYPQKIGFSETYHGIPNTFGSTKSRGGFGGILGNEGRSARDQKSEDSSKLCHGDYKICFKNRNVDVSYESSQLSWQCGYRIYLEFGVGLFFEDSVPCALLPPASSWRSRHKDLPQPRAAMFSVTTFQPP